MPAARQAATCLSPRTGSKLFGMLSFELFGQFNNVIEARDEFFGLQMEITADLIGL